MAKTPSTYAGRELQIILPHAVCKMSKLTNEKIR